MHSQTTDPSPPSPAGSPPRAFAQGVGVLLQTVGGVLFLSSCCVCSLSGLWDSSVVGEAPAWQSPPLARGVDELLAHPAQAGLMLMVVFSTLGGLSLAVCGLGLQADRGKAAWGATITAGLLTAVLVASGVMIWTDSAPFAARLWHLLLLALAVALLAFCVAALKQVLRHPPPANVDVVPPGAKIPYSFYHDDPPEVRLARELEQRRVKLAAQQKELEDLERDLRDKGVNPKE